MQENANFTLGTFDLTVGGKDGKVIPDFHYDRLAVDPNGKIRLIGFVADSSRAKAFRASAQMSEKGGHVKAAGGMISDGGEYSRPRHPGIVFFDPDGYRVFMHKLDYGQLHILMMSRSQSFLNVVNDETLFAALKDASYTTPVIPEWMPWLRERLERNGLLVKCACFQCDCAMLIATQGHIDVLVKEGLNSRKLLIPSPTEKHYESARRLRDLRAARANAAAEKAADPGVILTPANVEVE
jgi:hypothetical protein